MLSILFNSFNMLACIGIMITGFLAMWTKDYAAAAAYFSLVAVLDPFRAKGDT